MRRCCLSQMLSTVAVAVKVLGFSPPRFERLHRVQRPRSKRIVSTDPTNVQEQYYLCMYNAYLVYTWYCAYQLVGRGGGCGWQRSTHEVALDCVALVHTYMHTINEIYTRFKTGAEHAKRSTPGSCPLSGDSLL